MVFPNRFVRAYDRWVLVATKRLDILGERVTIAAYRSVAWVSLVFRALEFVLSVLFLGLGSYWILYDEAGVGAALAAGSLVLGKSHSLVFDVDAAMAERLTPEFSARAMAGLGRAMGLPAFTVMTLGSFKSVHEIAGMMTRFKPPSA